MSNLRYITAAAMTFVFMFPLAYFNLNDFTRRGRDGRFLRPITVSQREYNGKQFSGTRDRNRGYTIQRKLAILMAVNNCKNSEVKRTIHRTRVTCLD